MNDSLELVRFLLRYAGQIKELAAWTAATPFFSVFTIIFKELSLK